MVKISPRFMHALQKTGVKVSGYIKRKDMISFQNGEKDLIQYQKSILETPIYYVQLETGEYIGIISRCPIISVALTVLFLLGMVLTK